MLTLLTFSFLRCADSAHALIFLGAPVCRRDLASLKDTVIMISQKQTKSWFRVICVEFETPSMKAEVLACTYTVQTRALVR